MGDQKPREIAADILRRRNGREYTETLLDRALEGSGLSRPDRALCQELVFGVVRWQATLDWLIARKTNGRMQKPVLQNLLRLGLYQIFWMDRIPNHAAVNETVELARRNGFGQQAGFINAVLRNYIRESDSTRVLLADLRNSQPALGWSQPEWLVTRWQQRWGVGKTVALLERNNTPPNTFARVNTLKTDAGRLLEQWREENVEYDFVRRDWLDENLMFELKSHPALGGLPSFQQGLFYVQDPGTLLAVKELNPQPGDFVLDLCAAPGGKTSFIAQLMKNQGRIVASDVSEARLKLIGENCKRLGISCVETPANPTSIIGSVLFDRVLIDAPCSNSGVLRRRIDLRWRIESEELPRLQSVQMELLARGAAALKRGGTLVYSTCSLEPEENNDVVKHFLSQHSGFKLERQRELLPFEDNVDGAFVAVITRSS